MVDAHRLADDALQLLPGAAPATSHIRVTDGPGLASAFDVDRLVEGSVIAAAAAIGGCAELDETVTIDRARLHTTLTTHVTVDDRAIPGWGGLSGYYDTADDRTVQFHGNFAHHSDGIRSILGLAHDDGAEEAATAVRTWQAADLETALIDAGMIGALLRTLDEWADHPHHAATHDLPLLSTTELSHGEPRIGPAGTPAAPLRGLRVLDTSRVLAGPVAGQTLAAHGADVLRVGAAHLPHVEIGVLATGAGKRNAHVDLETAEGRALFEDLLSGADVWIDAYRPGAFADRGFDAPDVAERYPGLTIVQLCAFDWVGPWAGRRGFDSIVQSTTGVVRAGAEAAGLDVPTPLPVQALDYATGWFAAATAARLVSHQRSVGGSWLGRLSLLRTRNELVRSAVPRPFTPARPTPDPAAMDTMDAPEIGRLAIPAPVLGLRPAPPRPLGADEPAWLERTDQASSGRSR